MHELSVNTDRLVSTGHRQQSQVGSSDLPSSIDPVVSTYILGEGSVAVETARQIQRSSVALSEGLTSLSSTLFFSVSLEIYTRFRLYEKFHCCIIMSKL